MPLEESIYYGSGCRPEPGEIPVGMYAHPGVAQEYEVHYLFVASYINLSGLADADGVRMLCDC